MSASETIKTVVFDFARSLIEEHVATRSK